MQITSILLFILVIIYFSFSVVLIVLSKIQNKKGLAYLSLFFPLQGMQYLALGLLFLHVDISYSAFITGPINVILTPLLFLFIKKLSQKEKHLTRDEYVHFIPFVLDVILTLIIVPGNADRIVSGSNLNVGQYLQAFQEGNLYFNILAVTGRSIVFVQGILYTFLIYKLSKNYFAVMYRETSIITSANVSWIRFAALLIGCKALIAGANVFGIYSNPVLFFLLITFLITFGFFFFIHSITQPDISFIEELEEMVETDIEEENNSDKEINLLEVFIEKELYLNPNLTLEETATELNVAKYKLSQLIKNAGYKNFYGFVNAQRIKRSKKLLKRLPENYSLDSVATDSGFKARSTFYRVFKEATDTTPKEFIKQN